MVHLQSDVRPEAGTRRQGTPNRFGLTGIDHTAMPVRDPEKAAQFYVHVLGATVFHTIGFSQRERELGRVQHLFMHVGPTLMQVGFPHDGRTFPDPANPSGWPHWAFSVSAAALEENVARLRALGIPVAGPVHHGNHTSAHFQDIDGNKLELVTWEPYAEGRAEAPGRTPDWPALANGWRPTAEQAFRLGPTPHSGDRAAYPTNPFGLNGLDHFGLPVRDLDLAMAFAGEFVGAELYAAGGWSAGAPTRFAFLRVGPSLLQLGHPEDNRSFADGRNPSGWPHWAWGVSPADLGRAAERLVAAGLPINGPTDHGPGAPGVSVYFQDPDGNKLEVITWDAYPEEKTHHMTGAQTNDWPRLAHAWRAS